MDTVQNTLKAVLADPLAEARAAQHPVGYIGFDLPPDFALACDRVFCHLPWYKNKATPTADQWLESSFPGWSRSILQSWAEGEFDCFDSVVFSRSDDATQRLYYYICELQRQGQLSGPRALVLDVASIPRQSSIRHNRQAIARLFEELGIDSRNLVQGIDAANLRRQWYQQIASSHAVAGHAIEQLSRAILFRDLYETLGTADFPHLHNSKRVLLAGSAPPDDHMHLAIEAAGWNVCSELHQRTLTRFGEAISDYSSDPLDDLARRLNEFPYSSRTFTDRTAALMHAVTESGAQAVVIWLTEEDESLAWNVAAQRAALVSANIPALVLTRCCWNGSDGAADDIVNFLKELQE